MTHLSSDYNSWLEESEERATSNQLFCFFFGGGGVVVGALTLHHQWIWQAGCEECVCVQQHGSQMEDDMSVVVPRGPLAAFTPGETSSPMDGKTEEYKKDLYRR